MWLDSLLFRVLHYRAGSCAPLDLPALGLARFGASLEIVLTVLAAGGSGGRSTLGRSLGAVALVYGLSEAVGHLTKRSRPFVIEPGVRRLLEHRPNRSFPSRHVASAVAMALVVGRVAPRFGSAMGWLAVGIGLGRARAGLHYPTDLLAGALLGVVIGLLSRDRPPLESDSSR
jgi:undecaprenyl-diphosphatase